MTQRAAALAAEMLMAPRLRAILGEICERADGLEGCRSASACPLHAVCESAGEQNAGEETVEAVAGSSRRALEAMGGGALANEGACRIGAPGVFVCLWCKNAGLHPYDAPDKLREERRMQRE